MFLKKRRCDHLRGKGKTTQNLCHQQIRCSVADRQGAWMTNTQIRKIRMDMHRKYCKCALLNVLEWITRPIIFVDLRLARTEMRFVRRAMPRSKNNKSSDFEGAGFTEATGEPMLGVLTCNGNGFYTVPYQFCPTFRTLPIIATSTEGVISCSLRRRALRWSISSLPFEAAMFPLSWRYPIKRAETMPHSREKCQYFRHDISVRRFFLRQTALDGREIVWWVCVGLMTGAVLTIFIARRIINCVASRSSPNHVWFDTQYILSH